MNRESIRTFFGRLKAGGRTRAGTDGKVQEGLYARLTEAMLVQQVYTDPGLTRASLAAMLGTNEKYLHQAIRTHEGLTVSEYIDRLRMVHAVRILCAPESRTVQAVAAACGFGSGNTFHRRFREQTGLTPGQFRMLSAHSKQRYAEQITTQVLHKQQ